MDHGRISRCLLVLLLIVLATGLPSRAQAATGWLDSSFGTGGKVTTPLGDNTVHDLDIQPDGKIIAAGRAANDNGNHDFALVRYNMDGSLDKTFGTDGTVITGFIEYSTDSIGYIASGNAVAIQADNKIVVAGQVYTSLDQNNADFAVVRYNADGSLDRDFGTEGKTTTDFFEDIDIGHAVAIQADGKIVVAGSASNLSGSHFAMARYNPDGSLDETFGTNGKVTTDFTGYHEAGFSMAIQADGKIVIAGRFHSGVSDNYDVAVARYDVNGNLDPSFHTDGKVTTDFFGHGDAGYSVAIQADGKIVVAGYAFNGDTRSDFAVVRYNSSGSLDETFDTDGKVTTDFFGSNEFGAAMAIAADGTIVVAGSHYTGSINGAGYSESDVAVVRYSASGSLDKTFGTGGKLTTDFFEDTDHASAVAIQTDGKIVAAGSAFNPMTSVREFALARYLKTSQAYTFHGFLAPLAPVSDGSTVNTGKAGRTYPVKWQLTDGSGAYVTALSAVTAIKQQTVGCGALASATSDPIDATTTGSTTLRYDNTANQYIYTWQTPTTPGCYLLTVTLDDGAVYTAAFQLS